MKIINSPIFITILVIISAFILKSQSKPVLATELRGAYEEIITIAEEAGSDAEKTEAIQAFAEQVAIQLKTGFSSGFSSDDGEETREEKFLRVKEDVIVTEIREIQSEWKGRQTTLFTIQNNSEYPISQMQVNLQFYRDDKLIDVKSERIHEVKVLDSGESITVKKERNTPSHLNEGQKTMFQFSDVKITVTSFHISE